MELESLPDNDPTNVNVIGEENKTREDQLLAKQKSQKDEEELQKEGKVTDPYHNSNGPSHIYFDHYNNNHHQKSNTKDIGDSNGFALSPAIYNLQEEKQKDVNVLNNVEKNSKANINQHKDSNEGNSFGDRSFLKKNLSNSDEGNKKSDKFSSFDTDAAAIFGGWDKNTKMEKKFKEDLSLHDLHQSSSLSASLPNYNPIFKREGGKSVLTKKATNNRYMKEPNVKERNQERKKQSLSKNNRRGEKEVREGEKEEYQRALISANFIPYNSLQRIRQSMTEEILILLEERQKKLQLKGFDMEAITEEEDGDRDKTSKTDDANNADMIMEKITEEDKESNLNRLITHNESLHKLATKLELLLFEETGNTNLLEYQNKSTLRERLIQLGLKKMESSKEMKKKLEQNESKPAKILDYSKLFGQSNTKTRVESSTEQIMETEPSKPNPYEEDNRMIEEKNKQADKIKSSSSNNNEENNSYTRTTKEAKTDTESEMDQNIEEISIDSKEFTECIAKLIKMISSKHRAWPLPLTSRYGSQLYRSNDSSSSSNHTKEPLKIGSNVYMVFSMNRSEWRSESRSSVSVAYKGQVIDVKAEGSGEERYDVGFEDGDLRRNVRRRSLSLEPPTGVKSYREYCEDRRKEKSSKYISSGETEEITQAIKSEDIPRALNLLQEMQERLRDEGASMEDLGALLQCEKSLHGFMVESQSSQPKEKTDKKKSEESRNPSLSHTTNALQTENSPVFNPSFENGAPPSIKSLGSLGRSLGEDDERLPPLFTLPVLPPPDKTEPVYLPNEDGSECNGLSPYQSDSDTSDSEHGPFDVSPPERKRSSQLDTTSNTSHGDLFRSSNIASYSNQSYRSNRYSYSYSERYQPRTGNSLLRAQTDKKKRPPLGSNFFDTLPRQ